MYLSEIKENKSTGYNKKYDINYKLAQRMDSVILPHIMLLGGDRLMIVYNMSIIALQLNLVLSL